MQRTVVLDRFYYLSILFVYTILKVVQPSYIKKIIKINSEIHPYETNKYRLSHTEDKLKLDNEESRFQGTSRIYPGPLKTSICI